MLPRAPFQGLAFFGLLTAAVAGCIEPAATDPGASMDGAGGLLDALLAPVFSPLKVVDDLRPGGEPVLAITPKGTLLLASHPGYTHMQKPPGPEAIAPSTGQSYMWRSTDGGETWSYVGLPAIGLGPRNAGPGAGDPDFDVAADGTVYFTDLAGLTQITVTKSTDDGETWLHTNPVASPWPGVDRQWLASYGSDVYLTAQRLPGGARFLAKADAATLVFEHVSTIPGRGPSGDLIADPNDGTIYLGDGAEAHRSTDGGATWETVGPGGGGDLALSEPAVDRAGNLYLTWLGSAGVSLAASGNKGDDWLPTLSVSDPIPELADGAAFLWPWVVAGDAGRVAVVWLAAPGDSDPTKAEGDWFLYGAFVLGADTVQPIVRAAKLAPEPVHAGRVCLSGTLCVATGGDRRLGDFFEAALAPDGRLHVAVPTTAAGDSVSHPAHLRQVGGPSLLADVGTVV